MEEYDEYEEDYEHPWSPDYEEDDGYDGDFDGDDDLTDPKPDEGHRSDDSLKQYLSYMGYPNGENRGRIVEGNKYAKLYPDTYEAHSYSCHSYLAEGASPDSIVISAIYVRDDSWPVAEQNLYFEYILSDESPWRDVIGKLDLNVIRSEEDQTILWIQVRNLRVNRYVMFHFLKGFRQIWEKRSAIRLFTDAIKEGKRGDELYQIFLVSQIFTGSGRLMIEWGGDHKGLRGFPTEALLSRKIIADLDKDTYKSSKRYFHGNELYVETFGPWVRQSEWAGTTTPAIKKLILEENTPVYGYFLQSPSYANGDSLEFEVVKKSIPRIIEGMTKACYDFVVKHPEEKAAT